MATSTLKSIPTYGEVRSEINKTASMWMYSTETTGNIALPSNSSHESLMIEVMWPMAINKKSVATPTCIFPLYAYSSRNETFVICVDINSFSMIAIDEDAMPTLKNMNSDIINNQLCKIYHEKNSNYLEISDNDNESFYDLSYWHLPDKTYAIYLRPFYTNED